MDKILLGLTIAIIAFDPHRKIRGLRTQYEQAREETESE